MIWTDADLPQAARLVAAVAFEQAGRCCTANRRVIVAESCRESFLQLLSGAIRLRSRGEIHCWLRLRLDLWLVSSSATASQPQSSRPARSTREPSGPRAATYPRRRRRHELGKYPPVIICCDEPSSPIVQEESFGPVLVVQTAHNWDHAIELCNGVRQGLVAAVFTGSRQIANRFLSEAQAGILKVTNPRDTQAWIFPSAGGKPRAWDRRSTGH